MIISLQLLRTPRLLDFLFTIAVGVAWALAALMTLRDPERNWITRAVGRWTEMWSDLPLSAPYRVQLWVGVVVGSLIAIVFSVLMVVFLIHGAG